MRGVVNAAEGEELDGAVGNRAPLRFGEVGEDRDRLKERLGDQGVLVAMVVQDAQRRRGADRVAVEVGEHLLAPLEADGP